MTFKEAFTEVIKGYDYQYPYKEKSNEEMAALIQAAATICVSRDTDEQLMGLLQKKAEESAVEQLKTRIVVLKKENQELAEQINEMFAREADKDDF
jgi:hypothetical protein